jgi:hypothetical protein
MVALRNIEETSTDSLDGYTYPESASSSFFGVATTAQFPSPGLVDAYYRARRDVRAGRVHRVASVDDLFAALDDPS